MKQQLWRALVRDAAKEAFLRGFNGSRSDKAWSPLPVLGKAHKRAIRALRDRYHAYGKVLSQSVWPLPDPEPAHKVARDLAEIQTKHRDRCREKGWTIPKRKVQEPCAVCEFAGLCKASKWTCSAFRFFVSPTRPEQGRPTQINTRFPIRVPDRDWVSSFPDKE